MVGEDGPLSLILQMDPFEQSAKLEKNSEGKLARVESKIAAEQVAVECAIGKSV